MSSIFLQYMHAKWPTPQVLIYNMVISTGSQVHWNSLYNHTRFVGSIWALQQSHSPIYSHGMLEPSIHRVMREEAYAFILFYFIFFFILKHLTYLTTAHSTLSRIMMEKEECWLFLLSSESENRFTIFQHLAMRCGSRCDSSNYFCIYT